MKSTISILAVAALLTGVTAGCGSSSTTPTHSPTPSPPSTPATTSAHASTTPATGLLKGEATSAATGDIPDNQIFLTFRNTAAGYSTSYPEGWARKGDANNVTFADKNNVIHIVIATAPAPTPSSMKAELTKLKASSPTLTFTTPRRVQLKSGPAIKATYTIPSAPNPVTGKRVLLVVDRYELSHRGKLATVDLGTAKGVDNVDAYRLISNSFRWR
jgi:hypothetical protein